MLGEDERHKPRFGVYSSTRSQESRRDMLRAIMTRSSPIGLFLVCSSGVIIAREDKCKYLLADLGW